VTTFEPLNRAAIVERLAERLVTIAPERVLRVAIDGAPALAPESLADELGTALTARGRPVGQVRAESYWKDASIRLEYGHQDVDSYLNWLDAAALQREVLDPSAISGSYLPSLRDPHTNRATRAEPVRLAPGGFVLVSGSLLLAYGLAFDLTVHLAASGSALARRTPSEHAWTLPAYAHYERDTCPQDTADVVVRLEDSRRPAVRGL